MQALAAQVRSGHVDVVGRSNGQTDSAECVGVRTASIGSGEGARFLKEASKRPTGSFKRAHAEAIQRLLSVVQGGMTPELLRSIMTSMPASRAAIMAPAIDATCRQWGILSKLEVAAFLAQCGMETGEFRLMEEVASGEAYEGRAGLGNTQPGDGPRFKGRGWIQITGRAIYTTASKALGIDLVSDPPRAATPEVAGLVSGWYWRKGSASGDLNRWANIGLQQIPFDDPLLQRVAGGPTRFKRMWDNKRAQRASQGKDTSMFDKTPIGFDVCTYGVNGGFNGKEVRDVLYRRALEKLPDNPISGGGGGGLAQTAGGVDLFTIAAAVMLAAAIRRRFF